MKCTRNGNHEKVFTMGVSGKEEVDTLQNLGKSKRSVTNEESVCCTQTSVLCMVSSTRLEGSFIMNTEQFKRIIRMFHKELSLYEEEVLEDGSEVYLKNSDEVMSDFNVYREYLNEEVLERPQLIKELGLLDE